jgi:hypothetical protein
LPAIRMIPLGRQLRAILAEMLENPRIKPGESRLLRLANVPGWNNRLRTPPIP